jgi:hypothetical protein
MATKQMKTKILLLNGVTSTWEEKKLYVLSKGEPAVEFVPGVGEQLTAVKVKVGDGINTYEALPYVGDEIAKDLADLVLKVNGIEDSLKTLGNEVFQIDATATQEDSAVLPTVGKDGKSALKSGSIAIIKRTIVEADASKSIEARYSYTAYAYDGTNWCAMDGNYSADNVFFSDDMTVTTKVGTIQTLTNGSATFAIKGKSLTQALNSLLAEEKNPATPAKPSISKITATAMKGYEVGTDVDVEYSLTTSASSYTYGPATGVEFTGYSVTLNGETKDTKSGSFSTITVGDNTNMTISATATYGDGVVPVTNLGNPCASKQIKAGTTDAKTSDALYGYRNWYTYVGTDNTTAIDSSFIRNKCTAKGNAKDAADVSLTVAAGITRVLVVVPTGKISGTETTISGYTKRMLACIDVDGMGLDIFNASPSKFTQSTVSVMDASGKNGMDYIVYAYENANGLAKTTLNVDIG